MKMIDVMGVMMRVVIGVIMSPIIMMLLGYVLIFGDEEIEDLINKAGDIIATGTPAGVGAGHDPQEWMYNGDVVEATVPTY